MNAISTHDTKRSEDARARINVLSELAAEWEKSLLRWKRLNQRHKGMVDGVAVPSPAEEVMLYQTLLGAWPLECGEEETFLHRVQEFLVKAVREAKVHSTWIRPNEAHERELLRFAREIFSSGQDSFRKDFLRLQRKLAWYGALNSLSQLLIKITAPGVPDFYQGCELWDFSMVDPDNRRPVDFHARIRMLEDLRRGESEKPRGLLREVVTGWQDGRIKLYLTDKALGFRHAHPELFHDGSYVPLEAAGARQQNLCAFARNKGDAWCVTVAPRLTTQLAPAGRMPLGATPWQETQLLLPASAPELWRNVLTGEEVVAEKLRDGRRRVKVAEVLKRFPVALLQGGV